MAIEDKDRIIEEIKTNNNQVLRELYLAHYRQVEAYIIQNSGSSQQAKDIYQDSFMLFWSHVKEDKFKPYNENSIGAYIFKISKYRWIDYLRSNEFKKETTLGTRVLIDNESEPLEFHIAENEKAERLEKALLSLGEECRALLMDFYFYKKSMRWIASKFKIGEASARNKKYRCLQTLKEIVLSEK